MGGRWFRGLGLGLDAVVGGIFRGCFLFPRVCGLDRGELRLRLVLFYYFLSSRSWLVSIA